jgi:hypothetical protein
MPELGNVPSIPFRVRGTFFLIFSKKKPNRKEKEIDVDKNK